MLPLSATERESVVRAHAALAREAERHPATTPLGLLFATSATNYLGLLAAADASHVAPDS